MAISNIKRILRQTVLFLLSLIRASVSLVLAAVVVMFLSSTIYMLNSKLFKFKDIDIVIIVTSAGIFVISLVLFVKIFFKTYRYLKERSAEDAGV